MSSGAIPSDTAAIMDIVASDPASSLAGGAKAGTLVVPSCDISLLVPPSAWAAPCHVTEEGRPSTSTAVVSAEAVDGRGNLFGIVHGVAYVAKRDSFGKAVSELKVGVVLPPTMCI